MHKNIFSTKTKNILLWQNYVLTIYDYLLEGKLCLKCLRATS